MACVAPKHGTLMDLNCSGTIIRKPSAFRFPTVNSMTRTLPLAKFGCAIGNTKSPNVGLLKNVSSSTHLCNFVSLMGLVYFKAIETPHAVESRKRIAAAEMTEMDGYGSVGFDGEDDEELRRRRRTGHGNKGKVPWNKGRKHTEETRERIRQRTKEALQDPKVRKKMSECPRTLSTKTKGRIRASLSKLWDERLKEKRSRERFLQSWAHSIAEAARIGFSDQQELDWESYDKISKELATLRLRWAEEKAKVKEIACTRAERSAQEKAKKMAQLCQKRKEQEEKAKVKEEPSRRRNKRSKEEKEKLAESQEFKLKERLMKIHKKKSAVNRIGNQPRRLWEKLEMDLEKGEKLRKEISLADQIRHAKNRHVEQLLDKF